MDQRELSKLKLQRGLHLQDFGSFMLQSYLQLHIHIHLLIPTFKRKTLYKECYSFTRPFTSKTITWCILHLLFAAEETKGHTGEGSEHRPCGTLLAHLGLGLQIPGTSPATLQSGTLDGTIIFFINITC